VTICSDAHLPGELSLLYDDAKSLLKELGFKVIMIKTEHGWDENQI